MPVPGPHLVFTAKDADDRKIACVPFECGICSYRFNQPWQVRLHFMMDPPCSQRIKTHRKKK